MNGWKKKNYLHRGHLDYIMPNCAASSMTDKVLDKTNWLSQAQSF